MLPVESTDQAVELLGGARIQAGHRLIQQQQRIRSTQCARQQHALLLTAGERAVGLLAQVFDVQQRHLLVGLALEVLSIEEARTQLVDAAREHDLLHGGRKIPLHRRLLGQIADLVALQAVAVAHRSGAGVHQAQHGAHQRGLAGAVLADENHVVAPVHLVADVLHGGNALKGDGHIPQGDQSHAPRLLSVPTRSARRCPRGWFPGDRPGNCAPCGCAAPANSSDRS